MAVGEDSFLDTIANLVGMLIILVMLIGSQMKGAAQAIGIQKREEAAASLEDPAKKLDGLRQSVATQEQQLAQHQMELAYRQAERNEILTRVKMLDEAIKDELGKLDEDQKYQIEIQSEREKLKSKLSEIGDLGSKIEEKDQPVIELQHLPTPMAQTVFGRELHLRLRGNRLAVIPWDLLVDSLKRAAPLSAQRNQSKAIIDDTLGPIDGFLMKFRLRSSRSMVNRGGAVGVGSMIELDRFELVETEEGMGEPISEALADGSRLRVELAGRTSRDTVITVWVYPDSFEAFRQLKEALFRDGFLCAARPLPEGMPIGASPRGSRSSAQ